MQIVAARDVDAPRIPSDVFVEVVRVLLVALATTAGSSVHGAVGAALGACAGYVAGGVLGRFLRRATAHFEATVERTPAVTLMAGALGSVAMSSVGVIAGISAVVLLPDRWGYPILGIAAWTGVYAGFQVGARKGADLLELLRPLPTDAPALSYVPGQQVHLRITREGRESGQGVGYLPDGAMVVVADAVQRLGREVDAEITTSVPTSKGRLYFATLAA